jgi:hypothetical protein
MGPPRRLYDADCVNGADRWKPPWAASQPRPTNVGHLDICPGGYLLRHLIKFNWSNAFIRFPDWLLAVGPIGGQLINKQTLPGGDHGEIFHIPQV